MPLQRADLHPPVLDLLARGTVIPAIRWRSMPTGASTGGASAP